MATRYSIQLMLSIALALLLACCGDRSAERPLHELSGASMGTLFSIKLVAPPNELDVEILRRQITASLADFEQAMSTFIPNSELSLFNASRRTDWQVVSSEFCALIEEAQTISNFSEGAFDITVGPLVNLWGFGPDGPITQPPDAQDIEALMQNIGHAGLHTDCSVPALRKDQVDLYVDLSAFAKGYAVDQVAELLNINRVKNYVVEVGGELRLRGVNAQGEDWAIAIETPERSGRSVQTIVALTNTAMATSGDYRNYFEHGGNIYSHTIDPRTGYPVTHAGASVTVVADNAAFADAIATALLVLGPMDGLEFAERENIAAYFLLRIGSDIEERMTTLFAAEIFRQ